MTQKIDKNYFKIKRNIIAFDPGKTVTGVAYALGLDYTGLNNAGIILHSVKHRKATDGYDMLDRMFKTKWDVCIIEDFRLYPNESFGKTSMNAHPLTYSRLPTVQIVGILKFLAWKYNIPVVLQNASDVKKMNFGKVTYTGSTSVHAKDALAHIQLYFNKFKYSNRTLEF